MRNIYILLPNRLKKKKNEKHIDFISKQIEKNNKKQRINFKI